MQIRLISHASVVITCSNTAIWTDPWLLSKAFNDSWSLLPAADFQNSLLDGIDYIWLSHEHPDHLNFPTLASLPAEFKERVTILIHDNNPQRLIEPLRKLGYAHFRILPHRKVVELTPETRVYCYRVGTLDSCLGVTNRNETVFNINDAEANTRDCKTVLKDLGRVDVLLKQFSLAVHNGATDYARTLPAAAMNVLERLSTNHKDLGVNVTIPFASFMYFSAVDNKYMNAFANKPADVIEYCRARGQQVTLLYPGDRYTVNQPYDSREALERYKLLYSDLESLPYDVPPCVPLTQLAETFHSFVGNLRRRYPGVLLSRLQPLRIRIVDLAMTVEMSIADDSIVERPEGAPPDVIIYSQPLYYCFAYTWGLHTLTISARFQVANNVRNWKLHKMLFALNNAEVYLRPRYIFRQRNWSYLIDRLSGLPRYGWA
jgi:UDP-MurNAc hydroxylase